MKKIQLTLEFDRPDHLCLTLYSDSGETPAQGVWPEKEQIEFTPTLQVAVRFTSEWLKLAKSMFALK